MRSPCFSPVLAALLALLLLTLTACSAVTATPDPNAPEDTSKPPVQSGESDASAYEALIIQLQQSLLEERENRYISDAEYKARLAQLEAELEALRSLQSGTSGKGDTAPSPDNAPADGIPDPDPAPSTESDGNFSYTYSIEDGRVTICAYLGGSTTVVLPATVDGYPVTAIGDNAFKNSSVTTVIVPSTVTDIGWFAFYGCTSLSSVTLPASVSMIHYAAFDACPSLTILCPKNSYAASYVQSFGLRCEFI